MKSEKINLCDLPYAELERFAVEELGFKKFRAGQIWQWIWAKNISGFDAMTDLSQADRAKLEEKAVIRWPSIADVRVSSDGTTKFLLELFDGELIETAPICWRGKIQARRHLERCNKQTHPMRFCELQRLRAPRLPRLLGKALLLGRLCRKRLPLNG